jgi:pSer/pThr/pTyr-binding forkhead associated (FHA) protein
MSQNQAAVPDSSPQRTFALAYEHGQATLPAGTFFLGRDRACFIRLVDSTISRKHLRLEVGDELLVTDLGSHNGTLINGRYLRGAVSLQDGDEIELGAHCFRVEVCEDATDELDSQNTDSLVLGDVTAGHVFASRSPTASTYEAVEAERTTRPTEPRPHQKAAKARPREDWAEQPTRRAPRVRITLPVSYESRNLSTAGDTANLSHLGAFIVTDQLDDAGTPCRLRVSLSGDGWTAAVSGTVLHTIHRGVAGQRGMAVEFDEPSDEIAKWLEKRR